ncbi:unnamed protein product [Bemisia tabaci]|uniref:Uncharacterized protein n=1 Tax=Bemisia tabaci TaxID=7038 RepID=A0A9P0C997_BEMTA|nr:unnamed protein product [Bemisia tabaci]
MDIGTKCACILTLATFISTRGDETNDCYLPPFVCTMIPKDELMWAYPEWQIVGSYRDMLFAYDLAVEIANKIQESGQSDSTGLVKPNITTWKISHWPEKLDPKYLTMARDAKKLQLVNGELEDITGPFHVPGKKVIDAGLFPALRQIPGAEIFSFSHNKIKDIKTDTFRYNLALREIYLDHNEITKLSPDAFKHLRNLEKLVLSDNKITLVPHGLPPSLSHLDLSNNLCYQTTSSMDIILPEKLSYLNLCGNYLRNSKVFRRVSFANIKTLCIGDEGPQLPIELSHDLSALMRLQNLTLSAKRNDDNTDLTDRTAQDLKKLRSLVELNLDHYKLKDIDFIRPLDKLEVLRLHNIALSKKIEPTVSLRATLQDKKYIKILSLDGSPDLVELLRPFFACFPNLRTISLQRTGLSTLRADDFALNVAYTLRLDISYNPLACDADLDWICSETNISGSNFTLLGAENTYCTKPHLIRLTEFQAQNAQVVIGRLLGPVSKTSTSRTSISSRPLTSSSCV